MRQQPWFAIVVCVVSVLPGLLAGAIAAFIYRIFVSGQVGHNPDFFMMRTLFGIEAPGQFVQWLFFSGFPSFVHGAVAGVIAISVTTYICNGANLEPAAYSTGALYTGVVVVLIALHGITIGINTDMADSVMQLIGLWVGLFGTMASMPRRSPISNKIS